ncbi:MAG TPA: NADP-dependent malic enzyme [Spirochaetia bacterium]|nr:NADP-dependent malic enzyme [Spirochaetia bacterium]
MNQARDERHARRGGPLRTTKEEALRYHEEGKPGKIEVVPTKPVSSQYDLALAYSPGVAEPCRAIVENPDDAYRYTAKGNLVAVVTNGSAVLGLGNIGADAAKPVMEGKAVLFKRFAGIDVFDLEIDCADPDAFIEIVRCLEPTFGGINLEDIKSPECFRIEQELKSACSIPVMHDDQHGTAIISGAALMNGLILQKKRIDEVQIVVVGAGAAALACTKFYLLIGAKIENIVIVDRDGVIRKGEVEESDVRAPFATDRQIRTLGEALAGADVLVGLSAGGIVTPQHIAAMAPNPIIFALANPDPEIDYETAVSTRPDAIVATGRSDWPNQVNNVLGFPFIFRGALDVGAREINEEMKLAAARALADLAREPVPDAVNRAYAGTEFGFGREYLIPKPLDPRLLTTVAPAVARAAIESGVARRTIEDWRQYEVELLSRVGVGQKLVTGILNRARKAPKRVVFAEADTYNVLKAAQIVRDQGIAEPVLLGSKSRIRKLILDHQIEGLDGCEVLNPESEEAMIDEFAQVLYEKRQRKGVTLYDARKAMIDRNYFGCAMLAMGRVDALISGMTKEYPKIIRPALQVIGPQAGVRKVAGMYIVNSSRGVYFFADTTVNLAPTVEDLVDIIGLTARTVRFFDVEPVVAVLSYSNFGSTRAEESDRARAAVEAAKARYPELTIDGEIQANIALDGELLAETYPFSDLVGKKPNTFVFPNLASGNIAYKLLHEIGGAEIIGPVLMGMARPVHILQLGSSVREIVNMTSLAVVEAQRNHDERERG